MFQSYQFKQSIKFKLLLLSTVYLFSPHEGTIDQVVLLTYFAEVLLA